jgi:hypothetical protein
VGNIRRGHATSVDGLVAGPDDGSKASMGEGGDRLLAGGRPKLKRPTNATAR